MAAVVLILVPHTQLDLRLIHPVRNLAQAARRQAAGKFEVWGGDLKTNFWRYPEIYGITPRSKSYHSIEGSA